MSFEKGGVADKFGNRYEDRWVVNQLLNLCCERILYVIHEPTGEFADDVDIEIQNIDGITELHQCKSSNGNKDKWDLADLNSKGIFLKAKKHLDADKDAQYKFVSSKSCEAMTTLITRAKNSSDSPIDFYNYQIKADANRNDEIIDKNFIKFLEYMRLTHGKEQDVSLAIDYLSRMEFVVFSGDEYWRRTIIDRLSDVFTSKPEDVYNHLIRYTIENNRLRHRITTSEINKYLASNEIYKVDLSNNHKIFPRIETLNEEFSSSFIPLDSGVLAREEVERIYSLVADGKSLLIHGKAGTGKSGCAGACAKIKSRASAIFGVKT